MPMQTEWMAPHRFSYLLENIAIASVIGIAIGCGFWMMTEVIHEIVNFSEVWINHICNSPNNTGCHRI